MIIMDLLVVVGLVIVIDIEIVVVLNVAGLAPREFALIVLFLLLSSSSSSSSSKIEFGPTSCTYPYIVVSSTKYPPHDSSNKIPLVVCPLNIPACPSPSTVSILTHQP